jgi:hypothetical protein
MSTDVVLDDLEQAIARRSSPDPRQNLDGAAQGGQRILQFMRDIGREALDRVHAIVKRLRHVAQSVGEMTDLVGSRREIGNLLSRLDAAPHAFGGLGELAHRFGDRSGKEHRQDEHDRREHEKEAQDRPSFRGDDGVDIAALRRQEKRAANLLPALDRHADRNDRLALRVDAHDRLGFAPQGVGNFGMRLCIADPGFVHAKFFGGGKPALDGQPQALEPRGVFRARIGGVRPHDDPARGERARVEQQQAVPVVDARPGSRRRDQPAQDRADAFGIDREFDRFVLALGRRGVFAGRQLKQFFRIDGDRIRFDRGRGGDRGRDDLALRAQALGARIDDVGAKLIEIEKADDQHEKAAQIEHDDAPRQRG